MTPKNIKVISDPAKQARCEIEAGLNSRDFPKQNSDARILRALHGALKLKHPLRGVLKDLGVDCRNLELGLEAWILSQDPEVLRLLKKARLQEKGSKYRDFEKVLKELENECKESGKKTRRRKWALWKNILALL